MKQRISSPQLTAQETQLIRQLRQQPEMAARVQVILDLAHAAEGPLKTADEIEALLIQELRQLGHTTMNQWATQAEERVSAELRSQDTTVRSRKKKTLTWWCVFGVVTVDDRIWRSQSQELPAPLARTPGRDATGTVAAAGARADGLWGGTFLCAGSGQCPGALRL